MEKYIFTTTEADDNVQSLEDPNNMAAHSNSAGGSTRNQMRGFELIQKVFDLITIQDWLKLQMSLKNNHHYQKSELVDMDINSKIMEAVQFVNENNFNAIALTSNERSQIQGLINNHEIITFLVNNYKGEIGFFRHPFSKFDTNISHCSKNQNLVRAQHTDTLFEVLQKMRDFRISSIIIER